MIHDTLRELIQLLWEDRQSCAFSDRALYSRLSADGGLDAQDLSESLITDLLVEKQPKDWNPIIFACSELVAFYLALDHEMSAEQVACASFAACVLADAARTGEGDWSLEHSKVVRLCNVVVKRVREEKSLLFMRYVFGKGGQAPVNLDIEISRDSF